MDTNETYSEDAANASRLKTAAPAVVADPEPDSEPERDGLPPRQRRVVLGIMVSGTTAACISQSMMIAALPAVMHEYGISASSGQLLTTAYIFVLGLISAMTGYLMNRFDSKKLFFASMASFANGALRPSLRRTIRACWRRACCRRAAPASACRLCSWWR